MKKTNIKLWAGVFLALFTVSSCDEKLDINDNPNAATTADVELVLPQAIVASANIANQFNTYGGHFGGYIANAGGFSGFGNLLSYNLTPADWNGLWVNTYQDPLNDLQYVINKTEGSDQYAYFNAVAKIMKVVNFQRLVDTFGDIPYSQALKGTGNLAPAYDDAATIYQDLFATLDEAIDQIDNAIVPNRLRTANDPLFGSLTTTERNAGEQILDWKRYANTLKLRILIRLRTTPALAGFVTTGFTGLETAFLPKLDLTDPADPITVIPGGSAFLEDDAIVDPGYEKNRPNPAWATWGKTTTDVLSNTSRIPTTFSFAFFNGNKMTDAGRGETIFVNFGTPGTPTNQLGNEVNNPTAAPGLVTWASNDDARAGTGVLKGPAMGQPLMTFAEAKFLQAEAVVFGHLSHVAAATLFQDGIIASFAYLYKDQNEALIAGFVPATMAGAYATANAGNRLVDFSLATTDAQRLEAIITQKYIAMLMITSDESYNEYRRTGYPVSIGGGTASQDIASNKSTVNSRPDRLPTRIMYPSSESSYNSANYRLVDYGDERIFWDPN